MGRVAAEMLFEIIEREAETAEVDDVILTPALIRRASTAHAPAPAKSAE